ncbi:MAG: hypothetical protein IPK82_23915 [Polyangiaceae bacterium]|nr:hypothetical protein [Polyangiaceae bacterium]
MTVNHDAADHAGRLKDMMKTGAEYYGLAVYRVQNQDYAVGTREQVDKAVATVIKKELHGFAPDFLAGIVVRYNRHSEPFTIEEIKAALDSLLNSLGRKLFPFSK